MKKNRNITLAQESVNFFFRHAGSLCHEAQQMREADNIDEKKLEEIEAKYKVASYRFKKEKELVKKLLRNF